MKVKFSVIPFIPAVIAMLVLRVMSVVGVDGNGKFLGMDRMALSYIVIGIALALFVVCIIINIFDRKTAPVYPVKKNFAAGALAILSGIAVIASSCVSLLEITTNSEYFMMGVISTIFSIPAGFALLIMSRVHFTGKSTVSGASILYVFPALWGCTELVFEFLNATKVSISATDLTSLFCFIFLTLYYFSHSMVVSRIKGRNPVKACFIYGLPAAALTISHGVYMIVTTLHEGISYLPIVNAVSFIILGCYALSFIIEMTLNSFTKDQLEVVESLPEGEKLEEEEEKYVDTKGYDDLVFSNSASSTDPHVDPSDDYYSSAKGLDDFIMDFDAENGEDKKSSEDKKPVEKVKKPKFKKAKKHGVEPAHAQKAPVEAETEEPVIELEPAFEAPAAEPGVEEPVVEKPVRKSEIKTDTTSLKLEEELKRLSEKDYSKKDSEPAKENAPQPRIKTSDEEDIEARQSERLSEIDKLLQELDSKSE